MLAKHEENEARNDNRKSISVVIWLLFLSIEWNKQSMKAQAQQPNLPIHKADIKNCTQMDVHSLRPFWSI